MTEMASTEGGILVPKYFEDEAKEIRASGVPSKYFTKDDSEVPEDRIHTKYPKFRRRRDLFKVLPNGVTVYRIEATLGMRLVRRVRKGDLGGWIEKDSNLNRSKGCWIYDNACVFGEANLSGDATVQGNAMVWGPSCLFEKAVVKDNAWICGPSLGGLSTVSGNVVLFGGHGVAGMCQMEGDIVVNDKRDLIFDEGTYSCQGDVDDHLIRLAGVGIV